MELRHLRYFLAVGEVLNFTKAATQLRVAQPTPSRRVQNLEDEIGVDLLKHSPRDVTLAAGKKPRVALRSAAGGARTSATNSRQ